MLRAAPVAPGASQHTLPPPRLVPRLLTLAALNEVPVDPTVVPALAEFLGVVSDNGRA